MCHIPPSFFLINTGASFDSTRFSINRRECSVYMHWIKHHISPSRKPIDMRVYQKHFLKIDEVHELHLKAKLLPNIGRQSPVDVLVTWLLRKVPTLCAIYNCFLMNIAEMELYGDNSALPLLRSFWERCSEKEIAKARARYAATSFLSKLLMLRRKPF